MSDFLTPSEVESLAKAAGKSIAQVCREAVIAQSTFSRWKAGKTEPTMDVYRRIKAAATAQKKPAEQVVA